MRRRTLALIVTLAAIVLLAGACTDDADPDPDDLPTLVEPEDGTPDGFPTDDIPLVDGEVSTQGGAGADDAHLVIVRAEGLADDVREDAIALLTAQGFIVENTTEVAATGPQVNLASDDWVVLLTAQDDGSTTTVTYNVTPAP